MHVLSLLLLAIAIGYAAESWPQETFVVIATCSSGSDLSSCTYDLDPLGDIETRVNAFYAKIEDQPEAALTDDVEWSALPGHDVCDQLVRIYGLSTDKAERCMKMSYFLEYYGNTTLAAFERDSANIGGVSIGLTIMSETDRAEYPEDFMDAYRDATVVIEYRDQSGAVMARVVTVLGAMYFNFLTVHPVESRTNPALVLGHTIDYQYNHMKGTFQEFLTYWNRTSTDGRSYELASQTMWTALATIGPNGLEAVKTLLDTVYDTSDLTPQTTDVGERNWCEDIEEALADGQNCNPLMLPAAMFVYVDLAAPKELSKMYYTRYRSWTSTECQYLYPMDMNGLPQYGDGLQKKVVMLQNGDNFINVLPDNVTQLPNITSMCDTGRNMTYILYELYAYSSAYGMLAGFSTNDQNLANMYAGLRVWPTRFVNSVVVGAVNAESGVSEPYRMRTQKCTNVFADTQQKDVAGCVDVTSPWDTGVFVGSIVGIVVIIALWVLGFLYSSQFEKNPPEYYRVLKQYEPRVKELKEEKKLAKQRRKAEKKASKGTQKLLERTNSTTEEYDTGN